MNRGLLNESTEIFHKKVEHALAVCYNLSHLWFATWRNEFRSSLVFCTVGGVAPSERSAFHCITRKTVSGPLSTGNAPS